MDSEEAGERGVQGSGHHKNVLGTYSTDVRNQGDQRGAMLIGHGIYTGSLNQVLLFHGIYLIDKSKEVSKYLPTCL